MFLRIISVVFSFISVASAIPLWLGASGDFDESGFSESTRMNEEVVLDLNMLAWEPSNFEVAIWESETGEALPSEETLPNWFFRVEYVSPTENTLGELAHGDVKFIGGNESYCLTVGRYVKRDLFGWPMDLSVNGSVCFHPSNENQQDIFQYLLWVQFQWHSFPWDDHLRTRLGFGEGLSYLEHITYSETVRRENRDSLNLLNYLEFSISFNVRDVLDVTCLNRLIPGCNSEVFEDTWLIGSLHHRSGGNGLFGDYTDANGEKKPVTGGDNLFAIGLQMEF